MLKFYGCITGLLFPSSRAFVFTLRWADRSVHITLGLIKLCIADPTLDVALDVFAVTIVQAQEG